MFLFFLSILFYPHYLHSFWHFFLFCLLDKRSNFFLFSLSSTWRQFYTSDVPVCLACERVNVKPVFFYFSKIILFLYFFWHRIWIVVTQSRFLFYSISPALSLSLFLLPQMTIGPPSLKKNSERIFFFFIQTFFVVVALLAIAKVEGRK